MPRPDGIEMPSSSALSLFPSGDPNLPPTQILPPSLPGAPKQAPKPADSVAPAQKRDCSRTPRSTAEIAAAAAAATAAAAAQDAAIAEALRPRDPAAGAPATVAGERTVTEPHAEEDVPSTLE